MPAIVFVFLVILLQRANTNLLQSINPLFVRYVLGQPLFYVGATTAVYAVSTLAVRYIISIRVKPESVTKFVLAGLLIFIFAIAGCFFSGGYSEFLLFVVLSGFGTAIIMPFLLSLVHLVSEREVIEKNLTVYSLMLSLALVFGPLLSSALLSVSGIRYVYLMLCLFAAAAFAFALKIHDKAADAIKIRISRAASAAEEKNESKAKNRKPDAGSGGSVRGLFRNSGFLEVVFYNTVFSISFASIVALGGVFARDNFHIEYFQVTLLFSLFFISSLIARLVLLFFTRRGVIKNKVKILNLSLIISVAAFILMFFSHSVYLYALALVLFGIPHALIFPIGTMRISEVVAIKDVVAANTIYQSNFDIGGIIGPFLLAYIGSIYSIRFVFGLIAVFLFLAFLTGKAIELKKKN